MPPLTCAASATKRGRNSALAETAVRESKSFTDREALDQHLIDLIEPNDQALLAALDGRTVTRFDGAHRRHCTPPARRSRSTRRRVRQKIISAIADPNIALVLLVIGALCIYVEFTSPGLIAPGVVGAILVLLGLSAISVLPINWLGAALLVLAFTLFALEAKFASHGVLAVGGAVSMVLGAVMLIDSPLPGDAHPLEHRHRPGAAVFGHHGVAAVAGAARAARQSGNGERGHDRRDRLGAHAAGPRRQGLRARRILGRGVAAAGERRRARARRSHRQVEAHGGTGPGPEWRLKWIEHDPRSSSWSSS